jgi:integrase
MKGRSEAQIRRQMADLQAELDGAEQVGVYEDPERPGHWYIRINVNGGWTTRRATPDGKPLRSRDQALEAKGLWRSLNERSEVVRGRVLFRDFWAHYLAVAKADMQRRSWIDCRGHGTKRLLPELGDTLMSKLDYAAVNSWRSVMYELVEAGEIAPKTINNARQALMSCCALAVKERKMTFNPVKDVKPLRVDRVEPPFLRIAQIPTYVDAAAPYYYELAEFLIGTGVRISEAIAVRVTDIDLHECKVTIARQMDAGGTRATKANRVRIVYFGPRLAEILRTLILRRLAADVEDGGWLFLCPPPTRGRHAGRTEPQPPHRKTVHDWHEAALGAAGLPDMPLHALRHTAAASWLATPDAGGLEFVKRQLGHSTIKTTSDFYGHMDDEYRAAGARATEARIEQARQLGIVVSS